MSEMTAKEYFETEERLCNFYKDCDGCPLLRNNCCLRKSCYISEVNTRLMIVSAWGEEHPVKTLMDKFFEVFPDTPKYGNGAPKNICVRNLGYKDSFCGADSEYCLKCWSQPYIETKEEE